MAGFSHSSAEAMLDMINGIFSNVSQPSAVLLAVAELHVSAKNVGLLCTVCSVWSSLK